MNFVGIDLHKKTISICVVNQERDILDRRRFFCSVPERIVAFFESIKPFQAVVEYLIKAAVVQADRFVIEQLVAEFPMHMQELKEADKRLAAFACSNDPE